MKSRRILLIFIIFVCVSGILAKKVNVRFSFSPNINVKSVSLAGTFNNWSTTENYMSDDDGDGIWTIELELEEGEYQYKFVVNNKLWFQDFNNPLSAPDGYGGRNSVIRVGDYEKFLKTSRRGDGDIMIGAVLHEQKAPYFARVAENEYYIKLRTKQDDIDSVFLVFQKMRHKMNWYAFDGVFDYYIIRVNYNESKINYSFILCDGSKTANYGTVFEIIPSNVPIFHIPEWVTGAIFYQIFPERFCNGDMGNDPENVQPWGAIPQYNNFFGGDLAGIMNNLDYLVELGITALYLNPIFEAPSNHKYDVSDPLGIDPHFGNMEIFEALLDSCHRRGIKIIIDGVFHATGRQHWAFQDVIRNERNSEYVNWYNIYSFPVSNEDKPNYEAWWGFGALPSLMTENQGVREYLFNVIKFWTKLGIDGWRLDCPNEVEDEFWRLFRDTVRAINNECYILGEIWGDGGKWLKGDMFDAVMNYRFRDACLDFFAFDRIDSREFAMKYFSILASYLPNVNYCNFNLLGSHDTPRFLTLCRGDKNKLKLVWLFQMTSVGTPSIYYGDEIGMEGEKDPDCRKCFIWDTLSQDRVLREYMKKLIKARRKYNVLSKGDVVMYETPNNNSIIFHKTLGNQSAIIIINNGDRELIYNISSASTYYFDVLEERDIIFDDEDKQIAVSPRSGKIFVYSIK